MSPAKKADDLEISEDMDFQHKEWNAERWGWIFMLIVTIAALLGLFGQGPLSSASAEKDALHVRYGRFERLLAASQFNVRLDEAGAQNGEIRLQIDQSLLEAYTVQNIVPEPDSAELAPDQYLYVFKTPQAGPLPAIVFQFAGQAPRPNCGANQS